MSSDIRQKKFGRLIQKELSDIFLKDKLNVINDNFITISEVQMTSDLGLAKVYVTMMHAKKKLEVIEYLMQRKSEIRKSLGNRIKHQVRHTPDLKFYLDEVAENALRLEAIFESLNIPKE